jgi:hypothetical protein
MEGLQHYSGSMSDDPDIEQLRSALAAARAEKEAAEAKLADQRARLDALGAGREESMRALAEARDELRRLSVERDELRKHLTRIEGMQTSTLTLPDEPTSERRAMEAPLPSIEELMAGLNDMKGMGDVTAGAAAGHLHLRVQSPADGDDSEEMLSPEIVFPEQYAETAKAAGSGATHTSCVLVLLDGKQPIKYPIYKDEMTIGRADFADIQIDSHFISRIHARLIATPDGIVIEDVESKNGVKINAKPTQRQPLRHGDLLTLGGLRFRFLDTTADEA